MFFFNLFIGFNDGYRNDFNPSVTNAFAASAFRIGHTLIPDVIRTFNSITGKVIHFFFQKNFKMSLYFGLF